MSAPATPVFVTRPVYVPIPRLREVCPISGLTRDRMRDLTVPGPQNNHRPPVKSFVQRGPGGRVTLRLVHVDSLLEWMANNNEEETNE